MEEITNICVTCLSRDRCLVPLYKITTLLQEIRFLELATSRGGVCWECLSILRKFYKFKNRAKTAQNTLSQTTQLCNIKSLSTLMSKTNIFFDNEYTIYLDPLVSCSSKLKNETDNIKHETSSQSDDYRVDTPDFDLKTNVNEKISYIGDKKNENTSDIDEKSTDIPGKTENIVYAVEIKHSNKKLRNRSKSSFVEINLTKPRRKPRKKRETTKKYERKRKGKKEKADGKEFQEKYEEIVLSEEELERVREEKRNQHNFKRILYKCDSCVLGFTKEETYNLHIQKKHDESIGNEICDVCKVRFSHEVAMNNHKRKHYVVYKCLLCKYETHELFLIANHCEIKHRNDTLDRIHCRQCNYVANTIEDLENHLQTEHVLFCDCGVRFKDKSNLRRHMIIAHSTTRNFKCDMCKQTFKTKTRLESHMVNHDGNIAKKLAYCQQCNIQYKNILVYRSHLKTSAYHSEGYPCSKCNKKFKSKSYLKQHNDFYHLGKSQHCCDVCKKIFISKWRLHNHKEQYHSESRPRNHSCNVCGKKFYTVTTLRNHQYTHSDLRSFMCEDCGDTFKQRAALYTHTRLLHRDKIGQPRKKLETSC